MLAGENHALAIGAGGTVRAWGDDGFGELGDGTTAAHRARFQYVPGLTGITQVSASSTESSFAVRPDGTLFAWGNASNGQLGVGAGTLNRILSGPATAIAAGYLGSAVARPGGSPAAWGDGLTFPQVYASLTAVTQVALGHGIDLVAGQPSFVAVPDLHGDSVRQAATAPQDAGLVRGSQAGAADPSCDFTTKVTGQNPNAGTTAAAGSAVSITIGTRPKTPRP